MDNTETLRKEALMQVNSVTRDEQNQERPEDKVRRDLEKKHGEVYDTRQLQEHFVVEGFLAPYISVRRKSDGKKGSMEFTHSPRFYFGFRAE